MNTRRNATTEESFTQSPPRLNNSAYSRRDDHHISANGLNQSASENMSKLISLQERADSNVGASHFSSKQLDILKNSICKGVSNEEFEIFLMACHKTQLDPFMRQIYAVKRKAKKPDGSWGEVMSIQTGIDGYRLIAERTERYAPGQEPSYTHDEKGNLLSATAYVKKMTKDGTWHTVSASAYIDEYCQKTRDGQPMGMWSNMPRTMLAKCAESQALRKAFPAEMSGVYTKEEMAQAEAMDITPKISLDQAAELEALLYECDEGYQAWVASYIKKQYHTENLCDLPSEIYKRMRDATLKNRAQNQAKQTAALEHVEVEA